MAAGAGEPVADWAPARGVKCRFDRSGSGEILAWGGLPAESVFPIASVTKTFTADLILRSVSAGRMRLEDRLCDWIEGFRLENERAGKAMTVEDALCHYSGLPPHTWAWVYGEVERGTFIRERLPFLRCVPGDHRAAHRYSNLMYAVLGQVLESCDGNRWEQSLSDEILEALGLRRTRELEAGWVEKIPGMAPPHNRAGERIPAFTARKGHVIAPASELVSSAEDLARWGREMLRLGPDAERWRGRCRIGGTRCFRELGGLEYGLGWRVERVGGRLRVWHSGQCSGYSSLLVLYPAEGYGGVYLTNQSAQVDRLQGLDLVECGLMDEASVRVQLGEGEVEASGKREWGVAGNAELPQGCFWNDGYGALRLFEEAGRMRAQFQGQEPVDVETERGAGGLWMEMPGYGVRFPLARVGEDALAVPFEPEVPPICFRRRG